MIRLVMVIKMSMNEGLWIWKMKASIIPTLMVEKIFGTNPTTASLNLFLQKFSACSLVVNQRQEASCVQWWEHFSSTSHTPITNKSFSVI